MKQFSCLMLFLILSYSGYGYEERNLLEKQADVIRLKEILVPNQKWVPYPKYTDREGWDALTKEHKQMLIRRGEKHLNYEWKVIKATDYLEYERTGNRKIMENPNSSNNNAIADLAIAELAEGKGRFIDQLINGIVYSCEMTSWALSAHLPAQHSKRSLPDYTEHIIDLVSGDMGALLSWVYYFFHEEFDKVDPIISKRLYKEIKERIIDTYMQEDRFWWMAFDYKGQLVNNWNPWCNANVLQCFLLLENDKNKLADAVYRTMVSVDKFINYVHSDGACEEGPSYWGHAAGKMYDYLQLLYDATGGKLSLYTNPLIRNMGEYISRTYVGDGWVVNFADASAKGGGDAGLIFRYGKAIGSDEMQKYAAWLSRKKGGIVITSGRDIFRTLQCLLYSEDMQKTTPVHQTPEVTWYPETQFCYLKNKKGFFLAVKGGYNNESHNHNDVGTFSLYYNAVPVIIDAGVGTYTRQTFGKERYTIWTMQSNYHNLPMINGVPQKFGSEYKATDVVLDKKKKQLSMNIATAYPDNAEVEKWIRTYRLRDSSLDISDDFILKKLKNENQVNFLLWGDIDLNTAGKVKISVEGQIVELHYDKSLFTPSLETILLTDPRLSNVWGEKIFRLSLTAKKMVEKGRYVFSVKAL